MPVRRILVAVAFGATLAAQTVHLVGPGGFPQIQDAINAAANGDVVVIQTGSYLPFSLTKDLRLTAASGAVVDVARTLFSAPTSTVLHPPIQASLVGINFRVSPYSPWLASDVQVLGGGVHCSDCLFESTRFAFIPGLLVQAANLVLQRCLVLGGGAIGTTQPSSSAGCDGMKVVQGSVAAVDSVFWGGNINWDYTGHGGHAVYVDGSSLHLANCILIAGANDPLLVYQPAGDALHVASPSQVWLADCQLRGGNGHTMSGGAAVRNLGSIPVREARSTFQGGAGQPLGAAVAGPLVTAPLLGLVGPTPPIALGASWSVGFHTQPSTPMLVLWSDRVTPLTMSPVQEPVWLPPTAYGVAAVGITDAAGLLTFTTAVPSSPSLLHATFHVQGFAGATLPLEAAPPVGGMLR